MITQQYRMAFREDEEKELWMEYDYTKLGKLVWLGGIAMELCLQSTYFTWEEPEWVRTAFWYFGAY